MRFAAVLALTVLTAVSALKIHAQGPPENADLQTGMRYVDEGNFEAGIRTLDAVVRRLKASGDRPSELSRAYLYLGIAHLQLSQEQAARARFADAVRTDESLRLSPYEFPPAVIEAFERARKVDPRRGAGPPPPKVSTAQFIEAVKAGDLAAVRSLAAEDPEIVSSARDEEFQATPLHWAALRGHAPVAAVLMALGADLTAVNRDGETPQDVARRTRRKELIAILDPAAVSGPTRPAATPRPATLFEAVKAGDVEQVQARLKAEPGLVALRDTAFGATPLHWAVLRGHTEVVAVLLKAGADPGAFNNAGETPTEVARRVGRAEIEGILSQAPRPPASRFLDAVRAGDAAAVGGFLTEAPRWAKEADPTFGATPLHWAALRGHVDVVRVLLERGADPEARNKAGETPLDVARRAGRDEVARMLSR